MPPEPAVATPPRPHQRAWLEGEVSDPEAARHAVTAPAGTDNVGLGIAVAVVTAAFVVLMAVLSAMGIPEGFAGPLAAMPLGLITPIHREVRARVVRRRLGDGAPAKPQIDQSFAIAWYRIAIYATLILVALVNAASFVGAFLAASIGFPEDYSIVAGIFGGATASIVVAYLLGRWIGARADRLPVVTMLLVAVSSQVILTFIDLLLGSSLGERGEVDLGFLLGLVLVLHVIPWAVAGLIGVWRGHAMRWKSELGHVALRLPPERRDELVREARAAEAGG